MLNFEQAFRMLPVKGRLNRQSADLLWEAGRASEGAILEVGCYWGRSSCLLALLGRMVYCVDPFKDFDSDDPTGKDAHAGFLKNMKDRGHDNYILFKERIENWTIRAVGFAYLDGDHTYEGTCTQIKVALAAGAEDLCIHGYGSEQSGLQVRRAIEDCPITQQKREGEMVYCRRKNSS